jgi:hypothetical protein
MTFNQGIKSAVGGVVALLAIGFGVGSIDLAPPYAVVFIDDSSKTYIALPCIDEWQHRATTVVDVVRRGTVRDAIQLGYRKDDRCREAGGFQEDGRSLSGLILERVGILSPLEPWWDKPYRTEDGEVVFPRTGTLGSDARAAGYFYGRSGITSV